MLAPSDRIQARVRSRVFPHRDLEAVLWVRADAKEGDLVIVPDSPLVWTVDAVYLRSELPVAV